MSESAIPIGLPSVSRYVPLSDRKIATIHASIARSKQFTSSREQKHETSSGLSQVGDWPAGSFGVRRRRQSFQVLNTDRGRCLDPSDPFTDRNRRAPLPRGASGSKDFRQKSQGGLGP